MATGNKKTPNETRENQNNNSNDQQDFRTKKNGNEVFNVTNRTHSTKEEPTKKNSGRNKP